MTNSDDNIPSNYPYAWSSNSELSLPEFLTKYKPSMVQDDGSKPWLWVRKSTPPKEDDSISTAVGEAQNLLDEVTQRIEEIKNDDTIPIRSNKKKGTKSKKELREATQSDAAEKLKDISIKNGFISGKWLIFAPTDKVDLVWSTIATSLISGPLAETSAYMAKVATCPQSETPHYSHVLCLYVPDVYNKDDVTEIMKILLRQHGMNLMGVKSNLYTAIGLDSKHASGIPSTVWKNTSLLPDIEIKKLKEEFFAVLNTAKTTNAEKAASSDTTLSKPKLKKRARDNPFASDEDETVVTNNGPKRAVSKIKEPTNVGQTRDKIVHVPDDDAEHDEVKPRAQIKANQASAASAKPASKRREDQADETEEVRRRKRQNRN